jgi:hypothetical protein
MVIRAVGKKSRKENLARPRKVTAFPPNHDNAMTISMDQILTHMAWAN